MHDPKAHSKGGTLENTINGRADEEAAPAPQHLIHPGKDISKLYGTIKYSPKLSTRFEIFHFNGSLSNGMFQTLPGETEVCLIP